MCNMVFKNVILQQSTMYDGIDEYIKKRIRKYMGMYNDIKRRYADAVESLDIIPFEVNYSEAAPDAYSSDGSYTSYQRILPIGVNIVMIRGAGVELEYIPNTDVNMIEYREKDVRLFDSPFIVDNRMRAHRTPTKTIMEIIMGRIEKRLLYDYARTHKGKLIMVDGALIQPDISEKTWTREIWDILKKELESDENLRHIINNADMDSLIKMCKKNGHILVGVSKDSRLALAGQLPPISYEKAMEEKRLISNLGNRCFYYKLNDEQKKIATSTFNVPYKDEVGIVYARLHANAFKWHRVDYLISDNYDVEYILSQVAKYSACSTLLGTPIPQENCHNYAVRLEDEKVYVQNMIKELLHEMGFSYEDIEDTDIFGEVVNIKEGHETSDGTYR